MAAPVPPAGSAFARALRVASVVLVLVAPVLLWVVLTQARHHFRQLPIYGEREARAPGDTLFHRLPAFGATFENQDGRPFSADSLRGRMHVAAFIFTRCPGICRSLSKSMQDLQAEVDYAWRQTGDIRLVSYSIDPARDSLPTLRAYAQRHSATPGLWSFVRAPQDSVFRLAIGGYLVPVQGQGGVEDGFTHSEMLILVDPQLRIRGFYDGTRAAELKRLKDEIKVLRHEIAQAKGAAAG